MIRDAITALEDVRRASTSVRTQEALRQVIEELQTAEEGIAALADFLQSRGLFPKLLDEVSEGQLVALEQLLPEALETFRFSSSMQGFLGDEEEEEEDETAEDDATYEAGEDEENPLDLFFGEI